MKLAKAALLLTLASAAAWAQVNAGEQKPEASLPFTMTTVTTFNLPWRMAFLPDGRMLITEKVGPVWLVTQQGQKIRGRAVRPRSIGRARTACWASIVSPHYATDQSIYLTYVEPGDYGGGLALARAKLNVTATSARLENFEVLWHQMPKGKGGQEGGAVAFSPDGQYLFLTVGDRQRFTPAQDPRPARRQDPAPDAGRQTRPRQSQLRQNRRRHHSPDRSAQRHRSRQDREGGQHLYLPRPQPDAG